MSDAELRSLERRSQHPSASFQDKLAYAQALVRRGRTPEEQDALDAATNQDYAPALQLAQGPRPLKTYVVTPPIRNYYTLLIVGMPRSSIYDMFPSTEAAIYQLGLPLHVDTDDYVGVHRALYDELQVNEAIGVAKIQRFPDTFTKFITPHGDFITFSFHVIPFENLAVGLVEEYESQIKSLQISATRLIEQFLKYPVLQTMPAMEVGNRMTAIWAQIDSLAAGNNLQREALMRQLIHQDPVLSEFYHFAVQLGHGSARAAQLLQLLQSALPDQRISETLIFLQMLRADY